MVPEIRRTLYSVVWICLCWTKLSSADDLSDIGRCVASMSLYDADKDWYLDENEFVDVFLDMAGSCSHCGRSCNTQVYKELSCVCLDYDEDVTCCERGIARLGTYPVSYTNTVCTRLHEAAKHENCKFLGIGEEGNSWQPLLVAASVTTVLSLVSLSLFVAWRRWQRESDECAKNLSTHSALGIASRSTDTDVEHETAILCNGWIIEQGSNLVSPARPPSFECIEEEPSDLDE